MFCLRYIPCQHRRPYPSAIWLTRELLGALALSGGLESTFTAWPWGENDTIRHSHMKMYANYAILWTQLSLFILTIVNQHQNSRGFGGRGTGARDIGVRDKGHYKADWRVGRYFTGEIFTWFILCILIFFATFAGRGPRERMYQMYVL